MSDQYDTVLSVAETAFSRRLCGLSPREGAERYVGPFDFMAVVNAAELPRTNLPEAHRKAWAVFRQQFAQAWGKHYEEQARRGMQH